MARKYDQIDARLLAWLRTAPTEITTAKAIDALGITDTTTQRHLSRRFSLLEDRGALSCTLRGTTRVCTVLVDRLPEVLHKLRHRGTWQSAYQESQAPTEPVASIPATNSEEFLAAGGVIERLPSHWDALGPRKSAGPASLMDQIELMD